MASALAPYITILWKVTECKGRLLKGRQRKAKDVYELLQKTTELKGNGRL